MKIKIQDRGDRLVAPMPTDTNGVSWDEHRMAAAALTHFKADMGSRDGTSDILIRCGADKLDWVVFATLHGWGVEYV